ncbi:NADH dehydrogenase [ubiquinone] 1 beta subcomplex subunit 11, mitochondrial [Neosynchiropus ocellatus]
MLTRLSRLGPVLPRLLCNAPARFVSQSKSSGATGAGAVTQVHKGLDPHGHGEVSEYVKNPEYHGFSSDPVVDKWNMRIAFFLGVSVCLVIGGTYIYYLPDPKMKQWAKREAERVIVQRERDGLPLIDENYYDPSTIILPPAQEK